MKSLLILVLAVFAFAQGQSGFPQGHQVFTQGQTFFKQQQAYALIEQDKRNVAPICIALFQTLRDLTDQAIATKTLVNPDAILKLTGERLYAVLDPEIKQFTALLGSDANLLKLYNGLLPLVAQLVTDTVKWVNFVLSDPNIVLSSDTTRRVLHKAITDAEVYDLRLKEHLKAALIGYVNGILNIRV